MTITIITTALCASLLTVLSLQLMGWTPPNPVAVKLENAKVKISEVTYNPAVPRERFIRPTDQVIVFLDDCKYERKDSVTGEKTIRTRKAGEVIWHDKGEDAPVLTNLGTKPYRSLSIELKAQ